MEHPSRFWADWSTRDFAQWQARGALAQLVAVLPLGATEQHGPHLPLGVDSTIADAIVRASLPLLDAQVPALFLPTQRVGFSPEHAAFAGTLTLKAETVLRLWTDIGESVAATGVRKLVLFNAHGGHVGLMDAVARDLRARLGLTVWSVNWYDLPLVDAQGQDLRARLGAREQRFGIHAGAVETSLMLALAPEHVDMEQARDFVSASEARAQHYALLGNGRSAKLGWQMQDYNAQGAVGDARAASAELGALLMQACARALAALLLEVHAFA